MKKIQWEHLTAGFLILSLVVLLSAQYIHGRMITPPGMVYLGTVHWPSDYFYYLSQMMQGSSSWLTSTILFTGETITPVYIGWQTVLTGKLLLALGLSVIDAYQIAVVLYVAIFLALGYAVFRRLFPEHTKKPLVALFLFLFATSLPKHEMVDGVARWTFHTYWYNTGNTLGRFGPTPHHLLAGIASCVILLLVLSWWEKVPKGRKQNLMLAALAISGLLFASISPVHWGMLVAACGLTIVGRTMGWPKGWRLRFRHGLSDAIPILFLVVGGIPSAVYAKYVFSIPPYSYASLWEATQQLVIVPQTIIEGSGVIFPLAMLGLFPWFARKEKYGLILWYVGLSLFFYLSPVTGYLQLTNARFWTPLTYLFFAALATEAVWLLSLVWYRGRRVIGVLLLLLFTASVAPSHIFQVQSRLEANKPANAFYYIPQDAYAAYMEAERISAPKDLFLVQWPFNESFPAITGRKSFFGFHMLTINGIEKERQAFAFFDGKMSVDEMRAFLTGNGIRYVLVYPWTAKANEVPFLQKAYGNGLLTVYRVVL